MTNTTGVASREGGILKQDKLGRVLIAAERREALLEEFERSGMSGMQFAAYIGVKYPTFAYWKQKWQRRKATEKAKSVEKNGSLGRESLRWIEATLESKEGEESKQASALIVQLAGVGRLEISNPRQVELAALLLKRLASGGRAGC